jgi:hypothetical protein
MPVLLTSMSSRPNSSSALDTVSSWCASSSACPATQTALPSPMDAAASASASSLRAVMTTLAPSATSRSATASPMPRLAPVTIATLSSKRFCAGPSTGPIS